MNPVLKACLPCLAVASLLAQETAPKPRTEPMPIPRSIGLANPDPVVVSFAATGDVRLDPTYPRKLALGDFPPSVQALNIGVPYFNAVQLLATLRDVAAPGYPKAKYLFLTGDLIMGFQRDGGVALHNQLETFDKVWAREQESNPGVKALKLVPLPGNHEMTFKTYSKKGKATGDDNGDSAAWNAWIRAHGFDQYGSNGPAQDLEEDFGAAGKVFDDQSHVTYSFDDGPAHIVVVNTDTVSNVLTKEGYETEGLLPLKWLTADLDKAQQDPATKAIFVFGHKPAVRPGDFNDKLDAYDTLNPKVAERFRKLLVSHSKVAAYLCSHVHLFHVDSLADNAAPGDVQTRPLQIVGGNGGTTFETYWHPEKEAGLPGEKPATGPYFGYCKVDVTRSGKVSYRNYRRYPPTQAPDPAKAWFWDYDTAASAKAMPSGPSINIK